MYQIITASGTEYEIRNGRITRTGDVPVVGRDGFPEPRCEAIVNEPFVLDIPAQVGQRFQFRIKRTGGYVTTTPVQSIERYCRTHDFYGCWVCSPPVRSLSPA